MPEIYFDRYYRYDELTGLLQAYADGASRAGTVRVDTAQRG